MSDIPLLVDMTMKKLNKIPGATQSFYKQFKKNPQTVYAWRYAKSKPKPDDLASFIKAATAIIKQMEPEFKEISEKNDKATTELLSLING